MPEWAEHVGPRLAGLRLSPAREAEIVEELSQHLDQRYEELRRGGAADAEARRLALAELLEPDTLANYMRPLRQATQPLPITPGAPRSFLFRDLWQDLRYAARMLRKEPGFAAAAVLTLALGIGANSAIFALVDATLLRPLPFPDPERLVHVWERTDRTPRGRVSPLNLLDWNEQSRSFEIIAGFVPNVGGMVMRGADGMPETVPRQWVTSGVFDALGVKAISGRTFRPSDDAARGNVVVLSESFWRARFQADADVVGRDIRLDGELYTVVGVVPDQAQVIGRSSIWALATIQGAPPRARGQYALRAIGRLKPGVTFEAADGEMAVIAQGLARARAEVLGRQRDYFGARPTRGFPGSTGVLCRD